MDTLIADNITALKLKHSNLVESLTAQKKAHPFKFAFRINDGLFLDNVNKHPELVEKYFQTVQAWATEFSKMHLKDDTELMQAFRKKLYTSGIDGKLPFSLNYNTLSTHSNASIAIMDVNSGCCQHIASFERDIYNVMGKDAELVGCVTMPKKVNRVLATLMHATDSHVICAIKDARVTTDAGMISVKYLYSDSTNLNTYAKIKGSKILGEDDLSKALPKRLLTTVSFGTMAAPNEDKNMYGYVTGDPGVTSEIAKQINTRIKETERCFGEITMKYHESMVPKKYRTRTDKIMKYGTQIYGPKPNPKFPAPTSEQAVANARNPFRLGIMEQRDIMRNNKIAMLLTPRVKTKTRTSKRIGRLAHPRLPANTKMKFNISLT